MFGGKWVVSCSKNSSDQIWEQWVEVGMCVIGESFCRDGAMCGAVLSFRSKGRKEIHIWVDTVPANIEDERLFLKGLLGVDSAQFRAHDKGIAKVDKRKPGPKSKGPSNSKPNTPGDSASVTAPSTAPQSPVQTTATSLAHDAQEHEEQLPAPQQKARFVVLFVFCLLVILIIVKITYCCWVAILLLLSAGPNRVM